VLDILEGRPRGVAAPAEDDIAQPDDRRQVKAS
jgi:hypothetical protein